MCCYHLIAFTDYVSLDAQYSMGFSFLYTVLIFIMVNMIFISGDIVRIIKYMILSNYGPGPIEKFESCFSFTFSFAYKGFGEWSEDMKDSSKKNWGSFKEWSSLKWKVFKEFTAPEVELADIPKPKPRLRRDTVFEDPATLGEILEVPEVKPPA